MHIGVGHDKGQLYYTVFKKPDPATLSSNTNNLGSILTNSDTKHGDIYCWFLYVNVLQRNVAT